jgi:hypothetical protein
MLIQLRNGEGMRLNVIAGIFIRLRIGPVIESCEHHNEPLDSTKAGEFIS